MLGIKDRSSRRDIYVILKLWIFRDCLDIHDDKSSAFRLIGKSYMRIGIPLGFSRKPAKGTVNMYSRNQTSITEQSPTCLLLQATRNLERETTLYVSFATLLRNEQTVELQ